MFESRFVKSLFIGLTILTLIIGFKYNSIERKHVTCMLLANDIKNHNEVHDSKDYFVPKQYTEDQSFPYKFDNLNQEINNIKENPNYCLLIREDLNLGLGAYVLIIGTMLMVL